MATELPETLNSVLWVRSRDDTLAFGNVAGSATFQACVLSFIGLTFTSWRPGAAGVISGALTLRYADYEETYEAGDAYYAPPGHTPVVTEGTEVVEFSPTEALAQTMEVVGRNVAAEMVS